VALLDGQPALPPGAWHISDHAAALLRTGPAEAVAATHAATGCRFRLLVVDGKLVGLEPQDAAGYAVMAMDDPTRWGRSQGWTMRGQSGSSEEGR
jgi:hypothetical protein